MFEVRFPYQFSKELRRLNLQKKIKVTLNDDSEASLTRLLKILVPLFICFLVPSFNEIFHLIKVKCTFTYYYLTSDRHLFALIDR